MMDVRSISRLLSPPANHVLAASGLGHLELAARRGARGPQAEHREVEDRMGRHGRKARAGGRASAYPSIDILTVITETLTKMTFRRTAVPF